MLISGAQMDIHVVQVEDKENKETINKILKPSLSNTFIVDSSFNNECSSKTISTLQENINDSEGINIISEKNGGETWNGSSSEDIKNIKDVGIDACPLYPSRKEVIQPISKHDVVSQRFTPMHDKEPIRTNGRNTYNKTQQQQQQEEIKNNKKDKSLELRQKFKLVGNSVRKDVRLQKLKKIALKEVTGMSVKDISKAFESLSDSKICIDPVQEEIRLKRSRNMYRTGVRSGVREQYIKELSQNCPHNQSNSFLKRDADGQDLLEVLTTTEEHSNDKNNYAEQNEDGVTSSNSIIIQSSHISFEGDDETNYSDEKSSSTHEKKINLPIYQLDDDNDDNHNDLHFDPLLDGDEDVNSNNLNNTSSVSIKEISDTNQNDNINHFVDVAAAIENLLLLDTPDKENKPNVSKACDELNSTPSTSSVSINQDDVIDLDFSSKEVLCQQLNPKKEMKNHHNNDIIINDSLLFSPFIDDSYNYSEKKSNKLEFIEHENNSFRQLSSSNQAKDMFTNNNDILMGEKQCSKIINDKGQDNTKLSTTCIASNGNIGNNDYNMTTSNGIDKKMLASTTTCSTIIISTTRKPNKKKDCAFCRLIKKLRWTSDGNASTKYLS